MSAISLSSSVTDAGSTARGPTPGEVVAASAVSYPVKNALNNSTRSSFEWIPLILDIIANLLFIVLASVALMGGLGAEGKHHTTPFTFTQWGVTGLEAHTVGGWNTMGAVLAIGIIGLLSNIYVTLSFTVLSPGSQLQNSRFVLTLVESVMTPTLLISALVEYEAIDLYSAILAFCLTHVAQLSKSNFDWDALFEAPSGKAATDLFTTLWWSLLTIIVPILFVANSAGGYFGPSAGASLILLLVWYVIDSATLALFWSSIGTKEKKLPDWVYAWSPFVKKRLSGLSSMLVDEDRVALKKVDPSKLSYKALAHDDNTESKHRMWSLFTSLYTVLFRVTVTALLFSPLYVPTTETDHKENAKPNSVLGGYVLNGEDDGSAMRRVLQYTNSNVSIEEKVKCAERYDMIDRARAAALDKLTYTDGAHDDIRASNVNSTKGLRALGTLLRPVDMREVPVTSERLGDTRIGVLLDYYSIGQPYICSSMHAKLKGVARLTASRWQASFNTLTKMADSDIREWKDFTSGEGCFINGELCTETPEIDDFYGLLLPTYSSPSADKVRFIVRSSSGCRDINAFTHMISYYNNISPSKFRCVWPTAKHLATDTDHLFKPDMSSSYVSFCPRLGIYADLRPGARGQWNPDGGFFSDRYVTTTNVSDECTKYGSSQPALTYKSLRYGGKVGNIALGDEFYEKQVIYGRELLAPDVKVVTYDIPKASGYSVSLADGGYVTKVVLQADRGTPSAAPSQTSTVSSTVSSAPTRSNVSPTPTWSSIHIIK